MASIIQSFPKGSGKGGGHTVLDTDGVAVTQEENLQFTGLSVTDDSTNGITEVAGEGLNSDSIDDIASANSVVPAVIIGDANNYSTNEKVIGKWIDGKPLYQKTVYLNFIEDINPNTTLLKDYKYTFNLQSDINAQNTARNVECWYSCSSGVASKATLLWTNPSPTTAFNDQLLSIPECVDYNAVLIDSRFHITQTAYETVYCLGIIDQLAATANEASSNRTYGTYRTFTMKSNGIQFGKGQGIGNASIDVDVNADCIPLHVYGINLTDDGEITLPDVNCFFYPTGYTKKHNILNALSANDFAITKESVNTIYVKNSKGYWEAYMTFQYTKTT